MFWLIFFLYFIGIPVTYAIIECWFPNADAKVSAIFWPFVVLFVVCFGILLLFYGAIFLITFPFNLLTDGWIGRKLSAWFKRKMGGEPRR